jgi:ketosteroid isomerase-like protein
MAVADPEVELREWLDRLAIQDLIYRYSDAVTRADWQQCEAVFAPDAVWESPALGMRYESRASFLEILRATSVYDLLIQTAHPPVVLRQG